MRCCWCSLDEIPTFRGILNLTCSFSSILQDNVISKITSFTLVISVMHSACRCYFQLYKGASFTLLTLPITFKRQIFAWQRQQIESVISPCNNMKFVISFKTSYKSEYEKFSDLRENFLRNFGIPCQTKIACGQSNWVNESDHFASDRV